MLKRAKKVQRLIPDTQSSPLSVLLRTMRIADTLQQQICNAFIENLKKLNPKDPQLKFWYKELTEAQQRAIDCAHKAAPFKHGRLESIELKQTVEHRMVIRAPNKVKSVEEWAKLTGAEMGKLEDSKAKIKDITPPAPSIHDFDDDEDEISTQRQLN